MILSSDNTGKDETNFFQSHPEHFPRGQCDTVIHSGKFHFGTNIVCNKNFLYIEEDFQYSNVHFHGLTNHEFSAGL